MKNGELLTPLLGQDLQNGEVKGSPSCHPFQDDSSYLADVLVRSSDSSDNKNADGGHEDKQYLVEELSL